MFYVGFGAWVGEWHVDGWVGFLLVGLLDGGLFHGWVVVRFQGWVGSRVGGCLGG